MSLSTLVLRLTHLGVDKDGNTFTGSIYIPDLETGLEYQGRKSAVYVPYNGSIVIPISNRVVYSMKSGAIKKFVDDEMLEADTLVDVDGDLRFFNNPAKASHVLSSFTSGSYVQNGVLHNWWINFAQNLKIETDSIVATWTNTPSDDRVFRVEVCGPSTPPGSGQLLFNLRFTPSNWYASVENIQTGQLNISSGNSIRIVCPSEGDAGMTGITVSIIGTSSLYDI